MEESKNIPYFFLVIEEGAIFSPPANLNKLFFTNPVIMKIDMRTNKVMTNIFCLHV